MKIDKRYTTKSSSNFPGQWEKLQQDIDDKIQLLIDTNKTPLCPSRIKNLHSGKYTVEREYRDICLIKNTVDSELPLLINYDFLSRAKKVFKERLAVVVI